MSVKAPAEKNFRRAKVRPGGKGSGGPGGARWFSWRLARWSVATLLVLYAGYRGTNLVLHASGLQVRQGRKVPRAREVRPVHKARRDHKDPRAPQVRPARRR